MVCEVMGRYAGWIALHAGIAGGADVILIPELPYQTERVAAKVLERRRLGITHTLVCVSEGARPVGGGLVVQSAGDATQLERLGGAGERLARELTPLVGRDIRVTVLGHIQRGGSPDAYDRILATRFGVAAIEAVARGETGCLVALAGTAIRTVPLAEAVGRQKLVPLDHDLLAVARGTGCELGAPGGRP
jgi:6-phosphofructokinase 1